MVRLSHNVKQIRQNQVGKHGRRTTAPTSLLSTKDVPSVTTVSFLPLHSTTKGLVLWDVENLKPFLPLASLPAQLHRLQFFLHKSGCEDVTLVTAMNPRSLAACKSSGVWALLRACDIEVLETPDHPDAADIALVSRGYEAVQHVLVQKSNASSKLRDDRGHDAAADQDDCFTPNKHKSPHSSTGDVVAQHEQTALSEVQPDTSRQSSSHAGGRGETPCSDQKHQTFQKQQPPLTIICFSQDARFAQLLAYAADRGIYAVTMGPFKQGLRTANAKLNSPGLHLQQNPLCIASCASVKWTDEVSVLSSKEKAYIEEARQRAVGLHLGHVDAKPGDVNSARLPAALKDSLETLTHAPGKVHAVWLNPKFMT